MFFHDFAIGLVLVTSENFHLSFEIFFQVDRGRKKSLSLKTPNLGNQIQAHSMFTCARGLPIQCINIHGHFHLTCFILYTDVFRISRHCTRILTQITYQKSMQTPNWMVFLWVRWAWYPPFAKESILESFGDDRSPDGSPSNFWDEPTVLLDSTPASRRMSSRRTLRLGLTRV